MLHNFDCTISFCVAWNFIAGIIRLKEVFQPHPTMFQIAYKIHDIAFDIFKHFSWKIWHFPASFSNRIFHKDFMQQKEQIEIFLFSLHMPTRQYVCRNPYYIKKWGINNDKCLPYCTSICKVIYQRDIISVNG